MNILAIAATAVLMASGLSGGTDATAAPPSSLTTSAVSATATTPVVIDDLLGDGADVVADQAAVEANLAESGLDLISFDDHAGVVDLEVTSALGDGSIADSHLTFDAATGEAALAVESETDAVAGHFDLEISELNENEIAFTVTDLATGERHDVSSLEGDGAVAVVLGIPIALAALKALLAATLVVLIAGVTYIAASEAIAAIRRQNTGYNHYVAIISGSTLYLGNGLSYADAWRRVQADQNTWSTSQSGASSVCQQASGGQRPVGPEIDRAGSGKFNHFHRSTRSSAHCFFGLPRP